MTRPALPDGEIRLSPEVLFRELEGEAVLLDLRSQRYFGLDEVGTRIWQLLSELGRREGVLERLLEEFEVDRQTLARDLEGFLARLETAELIEVDARPAEPVARDEP
jgi:Coenzyme PQQ synthesis protein D (PqqD)